MSDTTPPAQGLSVRCPTCDAEPGQNCRQPLPALAAGPRISCPLCHAPAGQECRQKAVCHIAREHDAERAAKRETGTSRPKAKSADPRRNGRSTLKPGTLGPVNRGSALGRKPLPATSALGRSARPAYDIKLQADSYSKLVEVTLTSRATEAILQHAKAAGELETGGVLCGLRSSHGSRLVTDAGSPGEKAQATTHSYQADPWHDMSLVASLYSATGGEVVELGCWHTHPGGPETPSGPDCSISYGCRKRSGSAHTSGSSP